MSDGPLTARGYDSRELVSWLQKAIRGAEVEDALYVGAESERSGYGWWLWKRLRAIASGDEAGGPAGGVRGVGGPAAVGAARIVVQ